MKTQTEKELEREIDRLTGGYVPSTAKKMRKKIFEALEKVRQEGRILEMVGRKGKCTC